MQASRHLLPVCLTGFLAASALCPGGTSDAPAYAVLDLGTLCGGQCLPSHINDSGAVVGAARTAAGPLRAFAWTRGGGIKDLGTLGGKESWAWDVNASGAVVGRSQNRAGSTHAFLWHHSDGLEDLGTLGGRTSSAYG